MKVIIPLAGYGTRLRPHTYTKPKPLINVAGKPVLGHLLDKIAHLDISEYIFIVGYLGDQIEDYVNNEYKLNAPARFVVQKEMLGQAHAIYLTRQYLDESPAFVLFGDTLFDADLSVLSTTTADSVIFVREVPDPRSFGVTILDKDGYITEFQEKPESMENRLVAVGLYYFKHGSALINAIARMMERKIVRNKEYFLADAMQIMITDDHLKFRTAPIDVWLDTGRPESVLETNRYLLEHGRDNSAEYKAENGVIIIPPVNIHPTAKIERSVIGPYVTIAANCEIQNSILHDTIIDEGASCSEILMEQSLVGRNARVEDAFRRVNVGNSSAIGFSK